MNRRGFLGVVAAAITARLRPQPTPPWAGVDLASGPDATAVVRRYGAVTCERHRQLCRQGVHLHVFYQGRDVTSRCRFADDTHEGMAELLIRDAQGRTVLDQRHDVAKEIVYGVTFEEGAPFS